MSAQSRLDRLEAAMGLKAGRRHYFLGIYPEWEADRIPADEALYRDQLSMLVQSKVATGTASKSSRPFLSRLNLKARRMRLLRRLEDEHRRLNAGDRR